MIRLELSRAADADLSAILEYGVSAFGVEVAEAYFLSFEQAFDLIRRHPRIGAVVGAVRPPIRALPHRSHRILYDVFEDHVVVQRVLHLAMDVERWLG
jgi:toxin ParE1/3/4